MTPVPPKKRISDIDPDSLTEPRLSDRDRADYDEGWRNFNEGQFWEAHEAWEEVWLRISDDSRIFFQGIIQLAAAYHLIIVKQRYGGALRNLEKAEEKLKIFPAQFLRVDVSLLLKSIREGRAELETKGSRRISEFDRTLIPVVRVAGGDA